MSSNTEATTVLRRSTRQRVPSGRYKEDLNDEDENESSFSEMESEDEMTKRGKRKAKASTTPKRSVKSRKRKETNSTTPRRTPARQRRNSSEEERPSFENFIYDAILDSEISIDELASNWLDSYRENPDTSLRDFVNFVLKGCGCGIPIEIHDIQEPDSAIDCLAQIQEAFKFDALADYPLISRKPEYKNFRHNLVEFIEDIIYKAAEQGILYDNVRFIEDLRIWVASMSSSNLRSFRHTSTLIWLTIMSKLCDIHVTATHSTNQNQKILEAETSKNRPSGARLAQAKTAIELATNKISFLENCMNDIFETIFVHRYRDVDPKIRIECMKELGSWMEILPSYFFESKYIRYFGWLLSDISAHTRLQVLKSLTALYRIRDYIPGFRHFTDRFRLRIVEMAAMDADTNVRVAAIELLCVLREVGFLEDSDIEVCTKLVFDIDHRVRKSSAKFILSTVLEESTRALNEFTNNETKTFKEKFPDLKHEWLSFKELCYILKAENNSHTNNEDNLLEDIENVYPSFSSRMSLAGEALWDAGFGLKLKWVSLIKQLLFDFSSLDSIATSKSARNYIAAFSLDPDQELILLELLFGFVKGNIDEINHHNVTSLSTYSNMKKKKLTNDEVEAKFTQINAELIDAIPKLLQRYSHSPSAIVQVLRLHTLLDLNVYCQLHMESKYTDLFSSIINQFKSQVNRAVLEECVNVFSKTISNEPTLPFFEDAQQKVNEVIEDIGYEIKGVISENSNKQLDKNVSENEVDNAIFESIFKMDILSRNVDIQKPLEFHLSSDEDSQILVDKLVNYLSICAMKPKNSVNLQLVASLVNLLRSYAMWKLSSVLEAAITAGNGGGTRGIDLSPNAKETIVSILHELETTVSSASSFHVRSVCAKSLLELLVTVNVAVAQTTSIAKSIPDLDVLKLRLFDVPTKVSDFSQSVIMGLYLRKEKAYAKIVNLDLKSGERDADYLKSLKNLPLSQMTQSELETNDKDESDSELSDLSDIDSDDEEMLDKVITGSQPPTASQIHMAQVMDYGTLIEKLKSSSTKQERVLLVDYDLCQFAAKVRIAAIAKILDEVYVDRIFLNSPSLSSLYTRIISMRISSGENLTKMDESSSKTQELTADATAVPNSNTERADAQNDSNNNEIEKPNVDKTTLAPQENLTDSLNGSSRRNSSSGSLDINNRNEDADADDNGDEIVEVIGEIEEHDSNGEENKIKKTLADSDTSTNTATNGDEELNNDNEDVVLLDDGDDNDENNDNKV